MNKLYMMVGLPASGKSTIAKQIAESEKAIVVSSDELRKELLGDINDQSQNARIFEEVEKRIKDGLQRGNVVYDACNINYKKRRAFLQRLNKMEVEKIAVLVATPYEECLERNAQRERKVPEEVIKRMYYSFYIPQKYEGFDFVYIKYNDGHIFTFDNLQDISQDNPHHTLTVLEHCEKVYELLHDKRNTTESLSIRTAGLLHDIGKLKTKTFINKRGEMTDIAHFYDHEKVSAYDSLFYDVIVMLVNGDNQESVDTAIRILNLIQWHMLLHFNLSEKTKAKYKNMLGKDTWKDLEILHKADCEGR